MSYSYRNLYQLLNQKFWADWTFLYESGFLVKFCYDLPETLYMKNVINKLSFLPVTHTTCFDIRFDPYEFLKSDFHTDQVPDRLVIHVLDQVFGHKMSETCWGLNISSEAYLLSFLMPTQTHISYAQSHGYGCFGTATCRVNCLFENWVIEWVGAFGTFMDSDKITNFKLVIKVG
jgi:hypothetical protein